MAFGGTILHANGFVTKNEFDGINTLATKTGTGTLAISSTQGVHTVEGLSNGFALTAVGTTAILRAASSVQFTAGKEEWITYTWWSELNKAMAGTNIEFFLPRGTGDERLANLRASSNGTLTLLNGAGAAVTPGGKMSEVFKTGGLRRFDMQIWVHPEAAKSKIKIWMDNVELYSSTEFTLGNFAPTGYWCGWNATESTATISFADIIIYKGEERIPNAVVLWSLPTADKARTGWTAGAGGTTELFKANLNKPPTGVVEASATNTSQTKDGVSNTTDTYELECTSPTTMGIDATDEVLAAFAFQVAGSSAASAVTVGVTAVSNPAIAEATQASAALAAGTYPTNWRFQRTAITTLPTLTLANKPVVKLRKGTATTNKAMVAAAGMVYVVAPKPAGGENKVVEVNDTVTLSDATKLAVVKNLGDGITLSDSVAKAVVLKTALADTVTLSDAVKRAVVLNKADSVTLSDAVVKAIVLAKADTITLSDSVSRIAAYKLALADGITLADALSKAPAVAVKDTLTITDAAPKFAVGKGVADTITIADVVAKVVTMKAAADTVTISDAVSKAVRKTIAGDGVTITDAVTRAVKVGVADSVTISDTVKRAVVMALADTVTITDVVSKVVRLLALADSVTISDAVVKAVVHNLADSVTISDTVRKAVKIAQSDTVTISDLVETHILKDIDRYAFLGNETDVTELTRTITEAIVEVLVYEAILQEADPLDTLLIDPSSDVVLEARTTVVELEAPERVALVDSEDTRPE